MGSDFEIPFIKQSPYTSPKSRTFRRPQMNPTLRKWLGRNCAQPVKIAGYPLKLRGEFVSYHNLYHFEMSRLERILIGKDMVSGIHGFYSHMFHDAPIETEYDGVLDEARLAIHECMRQPSLYNILKLINWSRWLLLQGINPFAVIFRHARSLWRFRQTSNQPLVDGYFELNQRAEQIPLTQIMKNLKRVD